MILNENSLRYEQPNDININLKNHQLAMLNRALEIENNNEYAIMRDKPGSGKTYVVLALINELKKIDIKKKLPKKTNVIVVPQNIYFQWSYSIDRLTENLSYLKFVEYEHLLNLYNEPQNLYNKDIILVASSYYHSLSTTMKSLELNVDRLFIDEIDNVANLITSQFNTKFIMFISASFNIQNNNGYFTDKLKEQNEEEITILCDEKFIDEQINLEDPNEMKYLCKNLYVDKILVNIINEDELRNVNACYYKLNDKNFNNIIANDEKKLLSLICNENKSVIDNFKNKISDCDKNINFYQEKIDNQNEYINNFNLQIKNITKIFVFKKDSLKLTENLLTYFHFYINPILENEYQEFYDVIVTNRKNNLKEFKIYIHNLNEAVYNLYTLDLKNIGDGIQLNNIENLNKVFKMINAVIKNKDKEVDKFFADLLKINKLKNIDKFIIDFIDIYNEFEIYILNFNELLNNLEISLKSSDLLNILINENKKYTFELNNYLEKKESLIKSLKKNDVCPICYEIFENEKYYISKCCNNNICIKCTDHWFKSLKKEICIYCSTKNILLDSYLKYEKEDNIEVVEKSDKIELNENKEDYDIDKNYEIFQGSKINYLHDFILDLKNKDYKVILFCDFNTIFQKLEKICTENKIEFEDLEKGNITEIEKTISNYKYGNSKILFANSSLFSCGMNLENSTHIIFVHKMDIKIIDQTIGRAQRLGRQNRLNIIYLEYQNEVIENRKRYIEFYDKDIAESKSTSINDLNCQENIVNSENDENEIDINNLPDYSEIVDVNLDQLIASLE